MEIKISKELYSKTVLLKAVYKFTEDYYVHLSTNKDEYVIQARKKDNKEDETFEDKIMNELIEQTNRTIVFEETKNIRKMLFARAMASSVVFVDNDDSAIDLNVDDNNAMKDWFGE